MEKTYLKTLQSKASLLTKRERDRAFYAWSGDCLLGPTSLLPVLAFLVGYLSPQSMDSAQLIAQRIGLNNLVAVRTGSSEFAAAAYLFWLSFWMMLPIHMIWIYRKGIQRDMPGVLRTNLLTRLITDNQTYDEKYSLHEGYMRFLGFFVFFAFLLGTQLVIAHEPGSCKGCETSSSMGFMLINWLGTHILLLTTYIALSYVVYWQSIHKQLTQK